MTRRTRPPVQRSRSVTRWNRVLLVTVGLLLTAAGVLGLVAGLGGFGSGSSADPVLDPSITSFAEDHAWYYPVVGLVAVAVALIALWWLLLQLRTDKVSELSLEGDRRLGATEMPSRALADAVSTEAGSLLGVGDCRARLVGDAAAPRLELVVSLDGRAPVADVHSELVDGPVAHAREAMDDPELPVLTELRMVGREQRTVR